MQQPSRGPTRHGRPRPRGTAGFTLIEVLVTAGVLMIGLLAMTSTSVVVNSLRRNASDQQRAQAAIQAIVEDLHATARSADEAPAAWASEIIAAYGPGGTPGDEFDVDGLDRWQDFPTVAEVEIVTDETTTDAALGAAAGMPRDLDGDGVADSPDVTGSASLLPVVVRVRWQGASGRHQLHQVVYLLRY